MTLPDDLRSAAPGNAGAVPAQVVFPPERVRLRRRWVRWALAGARLDHRLSQVTYISWSFGPSTISLLSLGFADLGGIRSMSAVDCAPVVRRVL